MFYVVDSTGPQRYVWGPYETYETAVAAAGSSRRVIQGRVRNGQKLTEWEFVTLVRIGAIRKGSADASPLLP
jgi:hypothetical protein